MAEQFAPDQQAPVAVDPPAKRAKFLAKFAELDPDAELDEAALGGILTDEKKRDEFTSYVNKLNPDFTMNGQELADALGYGADVKKKPGGNDLATGGEPTGTASEAGLDPAIMQEQLGIKPVDISSQQLPLPELPPFGSPQAGALGYQLPGAPLPAAEQALAPQLESVVPFAPGTQANPLAANLPTIGTEAEPVDPRAPAPEEADYLQKLPVFTDGPAVEYGKERVAIPNDYAGAVPAGTYQLKLNGANDLTQYFDRPISREVDGKEQSYGDALAGKIKNALYSMGQGVAEGAQAVANTGLMATNPLSYAAGGGTDLGKEVSESIEKAKTPVAPYYQQSFGQHKNWETLGMAAADYAPMIIAQVAQTLAPELRAPAALQKAIGLVSATAFDADMYHAAHEHAEQIFPNEPGKADLYTLFEGTLTVAGFKAGSKLMTQLGDKLAYKASPFSLRRTVATDAVSRVAQMEAQLGRKLSQAEYQQALHESLRAALPKLAQIPKEAFQQAGTFGGVEAAKIIGNQAVAPALGGQADDLGPDPGIGFLSRVGDAMAGGATMGAITGGVAAALPGTPLVKQAEPEARPELAPLEEAATVTTPLPETAPLEEEAAVTTAAPAAESSTTNAPVPAAAAPSPIVAEPSPAEAPETAASAPDAATGSISTPEPLPAAEPHPDSLKVLTPKEQAKNAALDARDAYNELNKTEQKSEDGKRRRRELVKAAGKAGLTLVDNAATGKVSYQSRPTRSNEYTATTPAANHVPLDQRPAEARPFIDKVLDGAEENAGKLQGLGIKVRGKELSGRELRDAAKDIKEGRNTLRAQLILDTLENAHRAGSFRQTTGNGLGTEPHTGTIEEYMSAPEGSKLKGGDPKDLTDAELDSIYESDPKAKEAVDNYAFSDGTIDYERLAKDEPGLPFMFDVTDETATKLATLARERTSQPTETSQQPEAAADAGSPPQSDARADESSAPSQPAAEVAPMSPAPMSETSAAPRTLAEQNVQAKQEFSDALAEFRAARKKPSGVAQSSLLGIPSFSAEEAAALTKMAKAAVKLGAIKTREIVARLRDMGLTEDDATPEQLSRFVKQFREDEGLRQPKAPKQAADNPAEATGERAHAKRYSQATQDSLTGDERNYVPSKAKIAANEKPADYIKRVGAEEAYQVAVSAKAADIEDLLHDNLIRGVAEHFTTERNTALKAGDTEAANAAQERLMRLVGALAKTGTAQAQALQARVGAGGTIGDLVGAKDPAATGRATVDAAFGEIANRNVEGQKQNDTDAAEVQQQAKPKRQRKMADVLATPAVQAAIDKATGSTTPPTEAAPVDAPKYGESNKYFTKAKLAEWRKQLKGMAFSTPLPTGAILVGAYHLEASTRKFTDWSAKMIREVGVKIRPRLAELYDLSKAELLKKDPAASGFNTPDEVATIVGLQQVPGAVREGAKDLGKKLTDIAKQHAGDIDTDRRTLTDKFIQDAGLSGPAAKAVAAAIETEWNKRVEKAAWQSLRGRFQPKRTRAKVEALDRLVNDLNAASNLPPSTMRSPVAQLLEKLIGNNVPVSAAEAQHIEALKDAYVVAAKKTTRTIGGQQVEVQDTKAVAKAATEMLAAIGRLKNVDQQSWTRDVGAMFYASLLSSPNTHLANAYLNSLSTAHEVGLISSISTAANAGIRYAFNPIASLFPGYKRGLADAYDVAKTGIDLKTKVGGSLTDKDFQTDPLEEQSVVRRYGKTLLNTVGIGKGWAVPEKSAARVVRRALGASDTFFQGGLAEARAREIATKTAVRAVERQQASGQKMTGKEVRQFVADETDRILFNTPEAIADIKAIIVSEGLGNPKTVAEYAARQARIGDLLDQTRAAAHPELVADAKEFAARHAGNSDYEGHLGRFAYALADTFGSVPGIGKIVVPFAKVTSNFQNRYAEWSGLGFYRAIQGGAGKPVLGQFGGIDKRFVREYSPEEREKAFLRSTIGTLVGMTTAGLVKAGYVAITGLPSGNKDEDQQRPAQSIVMLKGPLEGTSFTYKGMNEEIALTTLAQTMAWAKKKKLADEDPDVADRLEAVALITAASTMNLGPSNGAGDFLGTISKVGTNPDAWFKTMERMGMVGTKSLLMPAGVSYAASLLNQATDTELPQKQSNDAWQQFKLQVWGDVPSWTGLSPDKAPALDIFGDPMKYASNRFWGTQPVSNDPRKTAIKALLVDKGLMPDEIRITDRRLRLYDPAHGNRVTELTNQEYHDFCQARGKAFYRELTENGELRLRKIREAKTPKAGVKARNEALETATDEAKKLIETRRANAGAAAKFKLNRAAKAEKELRMSRDTDD